MKTISLRNKITFVWLLSFDIVITLEAGKTHRAVFRQADQIDWQSNSHLALVGAYNARSLQSWSSAFLNVVIPKAKQMENLSSRTQ